MTIFFLFYGIFDQRNVLASIRDLLDVFIYILFMYILHNGAVINVVLLKFMMNVWGSCTQL